MQNVIDFNQKRQAKQAQEKAGEFADKLIGGFEPEEYRNQAIASLAGYAVNVEQYCTQYGPEKLLSTDAATTVIRASKLARWSLQTVNPQQIIINFDSSYFYVFNLPEHTGAALLAQFGRALKAECDLNWVIAERAQIKFSAMINEALIDTASQESQPEPAQKAPEKPAEKKSGGAGGAVSIMVNAHQAAQQAAQQAAEQFAKEYPEDWGSCGGAVVLVELGRKRKLKAQLTEAGIITDRTWVYCGRKAYVINVDYLIPGYNQQNAGYQSKPRRAYADRLADLLPELAGRVHVNTWCD